jgi:hypothetical protein
MWPLASAVFMTFGAFGFLVDVANRGGGQPGVLAALVILSGGTAVMYLLISTSRRLWLLAILIPLQVAILTWLNRTWPAVPATSAAALEKRLLLDAVGALIGIVSGYVFFMLFIVREGLNRVRFQTEIELARQIHESLVPPVLVRTRFCELYGRSLPVSEVGGDLVDAIVVNDGTIGFVADVSGHGVPAGSLMGMLKAALRVRCGGAAPAEAKLAAAGIAGLLETLNGTLLQLARPNMFATAAVVQIECARSVTYALAGHPPILHIRAEGGTVRLSEGGMALGIRSGEAYRCVQVAVVPGDVLAILTDGFMETMDAQDRELGMDAIADTLRQYRDSPLPELAERVFALAGAHGQRRDDQTLLLIRTLAA